MHDHAYGSSNRITQDVERIILRRWLEIPAANHPSGRVAGVLTLHMGVPLQTETDQMTAQAIRKDLEDRDAIALLHEFDKRT